MNFGKIIGALSKQGDSIGRGAIDIERNAMNFGGLEKGVHLNTQAHKYINSLEKEISAIDDALLKTGATQKLKEAEAKLSYMQKNNIYGTPAAHDAFSEYLRYSDKNPLYRRRQDIQRKLKNYKESIGIILDDGNQEVPF